MIAFKGANCKDMHTACRVAVVSHLSSLSKSNRFPCLRDVAFIRDGYSVLG